LIDVKRFLDHIPQMQQIPKEQVRRRIKAEHIWWQNPNITQDIYFGLRKRATIFYDPLARLPHIRGDFLVFLVSLVVLQFLQLSQYRPANEGVLSPFRTIVVSDAACI